MRTITAAQQGVLDNGNQAELVRVQVKDAGGTWRDLTTYPGFNAVKSVTWTENINDRHATFDITLFRELYSLSLSPYVSASALNRGFDPSASFAALLALNRELKIEVAIIAMDAQPQSGDWFEVFHGRIDTVDPGAAEGVELTGRALSGRLSQQYIKFERVYSYAVDGGHSVALRVWEADQVYNLDEYLLPASRADATSTNSADSGFNKFLKNSQAGTTGTTEPTWTTGSAQTDGSAKWDYIGAPTTAGNAVEQVMQNILDDNKGSGDPTVTLYTPSSPGWNIRQFIQQREFTLDAIVALAQQIGWDVRYLWRSGTAQFELTFYLPQRTSPTVLFTFGKSDYATPTQLKVDISTIRNTVRVIYGDRSDLWPDGTPKRKIIEVADSTSITKYGELWMEVQEDQTSQIDSSTEASAMALAALSDLKEPTAELDVPLMRGFPWVELNDYYTFSANGLQWDSDQSLAVVQYQHRHENGKLKTTLQTRGLPTIGANAWIGKRVNPRVPPKFFPHQSVQFNGTTTPGASINPIVGGHRIELAQGVDKRQLAEEYEHHVYTGSGATLDSSTLKAISKGRTLEVADLIPGKTYYHRVVPRFRNAERLIRGQPCREQSFVAGRASSGHVNEGIAVGDMPLNGGFETRLDGSGMPDHWTIINGSFGTDFDVMTDGNGISGGNYLKVINGTGALSKARSAMIPLINDDSLNSGVRLTQRYVLSAWVKTDAGNSAGNNLFVVAQGVDYTGALIGAMGSSGVSFVASNSNLGKWQRIEAVVHCDTFPTMRGVYVYVYQDTGGSVGTKYYVDEVRIWRLGSPWYIVNNTTYFTDNYQSLPAFANSWVADVTTPAFRRDPWGYVELKGSIKNGTIGAKAFTLPVGFRPAEQKRFAVISGFSTLAELDVATNGDVTPASGSNSWVSLDGVRFWPYS